MKNNYWYIVCCVMAFLVGYNMNNVAISFPKYKVAIIDVSTVMSKSTDIQNLKKAQDKEIEGLNNLISKAQNDLLNEPDKTKLLQKEAEYRKQIDEKRASIDKSYSDKLAKINDDIRKVIASEAKKSNYNLVLPTGMVITGGDDITSDVIKQIK